MSFKCGRDINTCLWYNVIIPEFENRKNHLNLQMIQNYLIGWFVILYTIPNLTNYTRNFSEQFKPDSYSNSTADALELLQSCTHSTDNAYPQRVASRHPVHERQREAIVLNKFWNPDRTIDYKHIEAFMHHKSLLLTIHIQQGIWTG